MYITTLKLHITKNLWSRAHTQQCEAGHIGIHVHHNLKLHTCITKTVKLHVHKERYILVPNCIRISCWMHLVALIWICCTKIFIFKLIEYTVIVWLLIDIILMPVNLKLKLFIHVHIHKFLCVCVLF